MKKIFLGVLLLSVLTAWAPTLEWGRNPEPNVAGYRIYTGRQSRLYDSVLDVGNDTLKELVTMPGTTFYAVTAYDTDGLESDFSDEVWYRPPGPVILTWQLPVGNFLIESCDDLTAAIWNFQAVVSGPVDYLIIVDLAVPHRFYRYNPALGSNLTGMFNRRNTVLRVNGR